VMSKVTMSQSFVVTNPEGWSYSVRPDDDNSDYVRLEYISDGVPSTYLVFTREEAVLIASAIQQLINKE
jgi:hypothetical protein